MTDTIPVAQPIYTFAHYFHYLAPLSIILMPFLPNKILFYVFPYPLLYYITWLIFEGCPLTRMIKQNTNHIHQDNNFTETFFYNANMKLSPYRIRIIENMVILLSVIISAYKLLFACRCKASLL